MLRLLCAAMTVGALLAVPAAYARQAAWAAPTVAAGTADDGAELTAAIDSAGRVMLVARTSQNGLAVTRCAGGGCSRATPFASGIADHAVTTTRTGKSTLAVVRKTDGGTYVAATASGKVATGFGRLAPIDGNHESGRRIALGTSPGGATAVLWERRARRAQGRLVVRWLGDRPQTVAKRGTPLAIAVNNRGAALAVWEEDVDGEYQDLFVRARIVHRDGEVGPVTTLDLGELLSDNDSFPEASAAISDDGRGLVTLVDDFLGFGGPDNMDGAGTYAYAALVERSPKRVTPTIRFGGDRAASFWRGDVPMAVWNNNRTVSAGRVEAEKVAAPRVLSAGQRNADYLAVAVGARGDVSAVWTFEPTHTTEDDARFASARLEPGSGAWSSVRVGGKVFPRRGDWFVVPFVAALAPDGSGRAVAAWGVSEETYNDGTQPLRFATTGPATRR